MKVLACVATLALSAAAFADQREAAPAPPKPSEEIMAIRPIFNGAIAANGRVLPGAMGPDSKDAPSHMTGTCKDLFGGLSYACDIQDKVGAGKTAMTWKGHMVVGWDVGAKAYKASVVDNMGAVGNYDGKLEGKTFTLETPTEVTEMGMKFKDRLVWDFSDPNAVKFIDQHQTGGGAWSTVEEQTGKGARAAGKRSDEGGTK